MADTTFAENAWLALNLIIGGVVFYALRQVVQWYQRMVRLQRWRSEQTSRATRRDRPVTATRNVTPSNALLAAPGVVDQMEQERRLPVAPVTSTSSYQVRTPAPPSYADRTPRARLTYERPAVSPSFRARTSQAETSLSYPSTRPPSARADPAPLVVELPRFQVPVREPEPTSTLEVPRAPRGTKRSVSMSNEHSDEANQRNLPRRKLESAQEGSEADRQDVGDVEAQEDEPMEELNNTDEDSSDDSMQSNSSDEVSDLRTPKRFDIPPIRRDGASNRTGGGKSIPGSANRNIGKAKSSASATKQTRDVGINVKAAAARVRKHRDRLPGESAVRNRHRVEEEKLATLDLGDTAEDLEGIRWKMGTDGKLRRLEQVRATKPKYDMPRGSTHSDALVQETVYLDTWLTEQEYDTKKDQLLLLHQKVEFEAKEAERKAAEAIEIRKRQDRERRKIEEQTREAQLAKERRKSVDRKIWGKKGGGANRAGSAVGDSSNAGESDDADASTSLAPSSVGPSRLASNASGIDSLANPRVRGLRATSRASSKEPSEFGERVRSSTPAMSFNGSFRSRRRREQVFGMETTPAPPDQVTPAPTPASPASNANVPSINLTPAQSSAQPEQPAASTTSKPFSFGTPKVSEPSNPTEAPNLAETPKPSLTFGAPKPSESKPAETPKPSFSFGAAKPAEASKPTEQPTTGFSFSASKPIEPAKPDEPAKFSAPKPAEPPMVGESSSKPSFTFGASKPTEPPKPDESSQSTFSFGGTKPAEPPKIGFSFGAPAAAPAPSVAPTTPTAPTPPKPLFGSASGNQPSTSTPSSPAKPFGTGASTTFASGKPAYSEEAQPAEAKPTLFGPSATQGPTKSRSSSSTPSFNFGASFTKPAAASGQAPSTPSFNFGTPSGPTPTSGAPSVPNFQFGVPSSSAPSVTQPGSSSTAPASGTGTFQFGTGGASTGPPKFTFGAPSSGSLNPPSSSFNFTPTFNAGKK